MTKQNMKIAFMLLLIHLGLNFNQPAFGAKDSTFTLLVQGRTLFYESIEESDRIDKAIQLFNEIGEDEIYIGIAQTYLGALTALKGKYAFFPIKKYRLVLKGLEMMDAGVSLTPDNIEARFIRGMTCFYLPFFFKRKGTAVEDFNDILQQLQKSYHQYDSDMVINVTSFFLENLDLDNNDIEILTDIQNKIKTNED